MTWPFDDEIPHEWSEDDLQHRIGVVSEIDPLGFRCTLVEPVGGDLLRIGDPEKGMKNTYLVLRRAGDWVVTWPTTSVWPVEVGNEVWLMASIGKLTLA